MGSLSNDQLSKLLNHFGVPDQGSRIKNISAFKGVADTLPLQVKNEDRSTPAPPKPIKPTTSRKPPSSRNSKSSRAPSLAPTEDSGYYSSTRGSAAGSTTSTRSQTPAIRQQSTPHPSTPQPSTSTPRFKINIPKTPPSVPPRKDTLIVSLSQAHSTVIPPVDESPASDDQVTPATETPSEAVSEENLSVMMKKGSSSKAETISEKNLDVMKKESWSEAEIPAESISEENLGVMEKEKDKAKWKWKEVARFDELPIHETDTKDDLYGDLFGIPRDSRTMPWSSMGGRPESNIGSSHSKRTESSSRDPEARPLPRFTLTEIELSSSTSKVTFTEPAKVIGKDKMEKWNPDPADYSSDDYEIGHLDQYRVAEYDYPSDDDIDTKWVVKSSEVEERDIPLTKEQLDFCWNTWNSVMKAYDRNLEKGISYEETGERLYRGEPLVQE